MRYLYTFTLFLFLALTIPFGVYAQVPDTGALFIFKITPTYPGPGDKVTIRVQSFSIDLDRAQVTWRANGRLLAQGTAVQEVSFEAGPLGSSTFVSISAFVDGELYSDQITVSPADIDIIWETDTYTPPFYSGKALPSAQAPVTIVALPRIVSIFGGSVQIRDLIFTWRENGRVLGNNSGRGKNILRTTGARLFNTKNIEVTATTIDGVTTAKRLLVLTPANPRVVFYENSPLLGMRFEKAIRSTFELKQEEVTVTAHPFYFSGSSRVRDSFEYSWVVNGRVVETLLEDRSSLVLRQTGNGEGSATIALTIQNLEEVLQRARNSFTITFSGGEREKLFGF